MTEDTSPGSFDRFYSRKWKGHEGFWLDHYPTWMGLYADILRRKKRFINAAVGACGRVLEIGCGAGDILADLRGTCASLVGIDIAVSNARQTRRNLEACRIREPLVLVGRGESLPLDAGTFDAVVMADVIEHVPEPRDVIREVHRVLRKAGKFVCVTPERNTLRLWEGLDRALRLQGFPVGDHDVFERFLTSRELAGMVSGGGFRVVRHSKICFYPGPEGGGLFAKFLRVAGFSRLLMEKVVEPSLRPVFAGLEALGLLNQKQLLVGERG